MNQSHRSNWFRLPQPAKELMLIFILCVFNLLFARRRSLSLSVTLTSPLPLSPVCRAGFYKSALGNTECPKCPPHSVSHHEGSLHCGCEKNYFRADGDPVSMACTRKCVYISLSPRYLIQITGERAPGWVGGFFSYFFFFLFLSSP